jgi:uncharacterized protein DUF6976
MRRHLLEVDEVAALIRRGDTLLLAGDEEPLRRLPAGKWIAGTIPYFMGEQGGVVDRRRVFVDELPARFAYAGIRRYGAADIARVYADLPPNGIGFIIAPNGSPVHLAFAIHAPLFHRFATAPLVGWISGVPLEDLGRSTPRVFDGGDAQALEEQAVVLQASMPPGAHAELAILNIFEPGSGPAITFPSTGFTARSAEIDGRPRDLAEYIAEARLDTRLPLVADYFGARINVSFQSVDAARGEVRFYAPVFAGVAYRHARPIGDYVEAFVSALPKGLEDRVAYSCNCVLNYVHSSLEGRTTGGITGPMTFGEIAYQLLNQTLVYLTVSDGGGGSAEPPHAPPGPTSGSAPSRGR